MMDKSRLLQEIRKISLKHIFVSLIPLVLVFILIYSIPFIEVFAPKTVTTAESAVEELNNGAKYVYLKPDVIYYSGYDLMKGNNNKGAYYYQIINRKCTFILMDEVNNAKDESYKKEGFLVKSRKTDGLFDNMLEIFSRDINWNYADLKQITNENMLIQADNYRYMYGVMLVVFTLIFSISFVETIKNVIYVISPTMHHSLRKIRKYAKYVSDKDMSVDIDEQLDTDFVEAGGMYITDKYFVHLGAYYISVVPIDEIVFIYKHSQRVNMPGRHFRITYTVHVLAKKKFSCICPSKLKEDADAILDGFASIHPDILNGYTDENKKLALKKMKAN